MKGHVSVFYPPPQVSYVILSSIYLKRFCKHSMCCCCTLYKSINGALPSLPRSQEKKCHDMFAALPDTQADTI